TELSKLLGVAYSQIRNLKWLPLIPGLNKFFYEDFRRMIDRKHGLCGDNDADSCYLRQVVGKWASEVFPKGTERRSAFKSQRQDRVRNAHRELRKFLAEKDAEEADWLRSF